VRERTFRMHHGGNNMVAAAYERRIHKNNIASEIMKMLHDIVERTFAPDADNGDVCHHTPEGINVLIIIFRVFEKKVYL
jgi:hypothetical protein